MIKEALALLGVVGMASAMTMPSAVPANAADNGEIVAQPTLLEPPIHLPLLADLYHFPYTDELRCWITPSNLLSETDY